MSRRQRGSRRTWDRPPAPPTPTSWAGDPAPGPAPDDDRELSLRERLAETTVPAFALLPLRLFVGVTFVYAGLDKLLDPAFFDPNSPASIQGQLTEFARVSPLAFLVRPAEPFAVPLGLLIALAEIAIGLGALSGLAFRLAAVGGAALSLMFWLTASWTTHPYYYGPDLPYALGWVTLALAGHGGLLVPSSVGRLGRSVADGFTWADAGGRLTRPPRGTVLEPSPERRMLLQAGVLAGLTLVVASLAVPLRFLRPSTRESQAADLGTDAGGASQGAGGTTGGTTDQGGVPATTGPAPTDAPAGGSTAAPFRPTGLTVASIAAVDSRGAARIRIPVDAPSPLPAGDPGIIVKLPDGTYVAYDATCTHQGCRVGWDSRDSVLLCPCHGAAFDAANHGAVLGGPTDVPLTEIPIVVDHQAGTISIKA